MAALHGAHNRESVPVDPCESVGGAPMRGYAVGYSPGVKGRRPGVSLPRSTYTEPDAPRAERRELVPCTGPCYGCGEEFSRKQASATREYRPFCKVCVRRAGVRLRGQGIALSPMLVVREIRRFRQYGSRKGRRPGVSLPRSTYTEPDAPRAELRELVPCTGPCYGCGEEFSRKQASATREYRPFCKVCVRRAGARLRGQGIALSPMLVVREIRRFRQYGSRKGPPPTHECAECGGGVSARRNPRDERLKPWCYACVNTARSRLEHRLGERPDSDTLYEHMLGAIPTPADVLRARMAKAAAEGRGVLLRAADVALLEGAP